MWQQVDLGYAFDDAQQLNLLPQELANLHGALNSSDPALQTCCFRCWIILMAAKQDHNMQASS